MMNGATLARVPAVVLVVLLALFGGVAMVGCGTGGESPAASAGEAGRSGPPRTERTIDGKTRPDVKVPDTPPPTKLIVKDLQVGQGRKARVGDRVKTELVGLLWNGESFTDSWGFPSPPIFELGGRTEPRLEYGLDLAVRGMRPGGRREVIVPAELLYWSDQPHEHLSSTNSVVFVVDLLEIE